MIQYHKLVRDKIPQIIEAAGEKPNIRILDEGEYLRLLDAKLDEEVAEFHKDRTAEELADILEVVLALAGSIGCSADELTEIYRKKHAQRGGFDHRILLISKEST